MNSTTAEAELRGVDLAGPPDGRPIVFLHGAIFTRKLWAPQRDDMQDEFRVVAPDLPGHGERSDEQFRLDRAVELVDEVVEAAAGGRALVVGLSLGGYVATAFAERYPEKVDGLVISGSSANPVGLLEPITEAVSATWRSVTKSRLGDRGVRWLAKRWVGNRDLPSETKAELVDAGFYPKAFGDAGFELAGTDFRSAFASYPGPALVLNGQMDLLNRKGERAHADAAENARVEVLEGAGHVCNLERPEAFADAVRRFDPADR